MPAGLHVKTSIMFFFCQFSLCVLLAAMIMVRQISSYSYKNVTQLKATLLTDYDPNMIPLNSQTDSLNVTVEMLLYQVLEVDTVKGVLWTTLALKCYWFDERINWAPSDYGGISSLMMQSKYVWNPPLTLGKPVEFTTFGESWMHVTYESNGAAFWRPAGVNELVCAMNMKYWPFDKQVCEITYFPYDYSNGQIRFIVTGLDTTFFIENGEWDLENTESSTRNIYGVDEALFRITITRRPAFYILTLLLPLGALGFLASFVFLLPSESGERVSYAITILLSLTVFLTIISDNIPKTSNPVPLVCIFLPASVFISSITTLIVILNLEIYHRSSDKKSIGRWYTTLVRLMRCRSNKVTETTVVEAFQTTDKVDRDNANKHETMLHVRRTHSTNTNDTLMATDKESNLNEKEHNNVDITWKDVSTAIDSLMFVCVTVFQFASSIIWIAIFLSRDCC